VQALNPLPSAKINKLNAESFFQGEYEATNGLLERSLPSHVARRIRIEVEPMGAC
jgi:hypothetical protein